MVLHVVNTPDVGPAVIACWHPAAGFPAPTVAISRTPRRHCAPAYLSSPPDVEMVDCYNLATG